MNEGEDVKSAMKRLKKELKQWEHQFQESNNRKPTKKDIAAIESIASKYKAYAKFKSANTEDEADQQASSARNSNTNLTSPAPNKVAEPEARSAVTVSSNAPSVATDLSNLPPLPSTDPTINKRYQVGDAPISKADIGQKVDRFAKLVQERQVRNQAASSIVAPLDSPGLSEALVSVQLTRVSTSSLEGVTSATKIEGLETQAPSLDSPLRTTTTQSGSKAAEYVPDTVGRSDEYKYLLERKQELHSLTVNQSSESDDSKYNSQEIDQKDKGTINGGEVALPAQPSNQDERMQDSDSDNGRPSIKPTTIPPPLPRRTSSAAQIEVQATTENTTMSEVAPQQKEAEIEIQPSDEADAPVAATTETAVIPAGLPKTLNAPVKTLPSLIIKDLFSRVDESGVLRCKLFRKKTVLGKGGSQTYLLHNEANNAFLLSAKKTLLSKAISYVISDHPDEITKDSPHYVAKLKANFMRTHFIVSDTRRPSKPVEIACVSYSKNVLPRELHVAIPAAAITDINHPDHTTDITADFKNKNEKNLFFLRNKAPRWNEATQSHCLNFGGRVTQPSIKNMQLISDITGLDYNILQFGRCGPDFFTLDVRWPMTPIEAFGIAITTFDAYDSA